MTRANEELKHGKRRRDEDGEEDEEVVRPPVRKKAKLAVSPS